MAVFGKKKLISQLEAAQRARVKGKEFIKLVDTAIESVQGDLAEDDRKALNALWFLKAEYLWASGEKGKALDLLAQNFDGPVEEDWTAIIAEWIRGDNITDIKYRRLLEIRLEIAPEDRRANMSLAKMVAEMPSPADEDIDIVVRAVKEFPLWKGGSSVLAIRYLENERTDADALEVYKFAYPYNKNNPKLIEYLTKSLIENQDKSEFALKFYRDQLEAGRDVPQALGLLCDAYLEKGDISPTTWPFIVDALGRGMLSPQGVKHVSDFVLTQQKEYFNRRTLAEQVYERGYRGAELLQYLADEYAADLEVNEKTVPVLESAFKQKALSKKSIRVLTEHYLQTGERGEFAARVYETYLSMVPELPQRKLYEYLAEHFISLGRTDEQAKKIYEEALAIKPDDERLVKMLAQTYLSYDIESMQAIEIYRRAYAVETDEATKQKLALMLAQHHTRVKKYDAETLEYLSALQGAFPSNLEKQFTEALGYCYMNLERTDAEAKAHYSRLYKASKNPHPKLVNILARIAVSEHKPGKPYSKDEIELFERVFDIERFSCQPEIAFSLLDDRLAKNTEDIRLIQFAVRCFEADVKRLAEVLDKYKASEIFVDIGDFYAERFNFEQASVAYRQAVDFTGLEKAKYRLAKMLINEGDANGALAILRTLNVDDSKSQSQVVYWEGVCHLVLGNAGEAMRCFEGIVSQKELESLMPGYLPLLRIGQALELDNKWEEARKRYREVLSVADAKHFHRWADIEIALLYMKEKRYEDAVKQAEDLYNRNRTGRAESRYFAMALLYKGAEALRSGDLDAATSLLQQAVQVDMADRLLRDVITDLLLIEGEKAYFAKDFSRSHKLFETSTAILPKRVDTRVFLAFTHHERREYDHAILQYVNIPWEQVHPDVERSQAYAYFSSGRFDKSWRVFNDLLQRGTFDEEDMPLLFFSFLSDKTARGGRVFKNIKFKDDSVDYAQLYIHDGQYQRAVDLLKDLQKRDEYKDDLTAMWFLGLANSRLGNREMAVHYWKEILVRPDRMNLDKSRKMQEYIEVGLAFLESGYAEEAMHTWESLSKIDPDFEHLPFLYAETLSLNAYQLVRKQDKVKVAINEWKKAYEYDPKNILLAQNLAIAYWEIDDFTNSTRYWNKMIDWWKRELVKKPKQNAVYSVYISEIQRVLTDLITTKGRADHDLAKVRTEDVIDYYQKANRFYWLLNLDKSATTMDIERSYFRLVKIYNPERHADTFMLLEEAYANLTDPNRKEKIDLFAYNPLALDTIRQRVWGGKEHINVFSPLKAKVNPPMPKSDFLKPSGLDPDAVLAKMENRMKMNLKLPDWNLV